MTPERKKLSYWDLLKSWVLWSFYSQACYNYERMQASGFAHSMIPIIKKLYTTKEDISAALKRHLVFFNTEPNVGAMVHGITAAMEEERANDQPITDEAINSVKTGLMGPLAGIGDTLSQGTVTPILLALGIGLAKDGNLFGPVVYILLEAAFIWGIGYFMFFQGYRMGKSAVERLLEGGLVKDLITGAGIVGATVIGALTASFVNLSTPITITVGQQVVKLQADFFDKIMPQLLPLALTLGVWWLLSKRKSPIALMGYLVVVGIVGSLLKVF